MAHIYIEGKTLPEIWERSVLECWEKGDSFKTEYDKPDDPPSRDCTAMLVATEPLVEPRIHRAFPGGLDDLEVYRQEVVDGVHDHWVDPEAGKWSYTYHQRLFAYDADGSVVDQIQHVIGRLSETPHTRRAQAITWKPTVDPNVDDPACLQRMWFRVNESDELVLQVSMRSNDAFKAAYMNMFAFTELQRIVAAQISENTGREIKVGPYTHFANSYHIYGSYFSDFEGFLKTVETREFDDRVWDSTSEMVQMSFDLGRDRLRAEREENSG
ncbi:thymidylate synthase [Candidatus Hydrogenedentota bacterium]